MDNILSLGSVGFITFGIVWAVSLFTDLDSKKKFGLSVVVAVLVSFVPIDLGNEIVNRIKEGIGVATGLTGFYQMMNKIKRA